MGCYNKDIEIEHKGALTMSKIIPARLADQPKDYERLGLSETILPWEDGLRTHGKFGEYEWWYFDAKLEDGSSLVITFYTSPMTAMTHGFDPSAAFTLTRADGSVLKDEVRLDMEQCSFAKDRCHVKIGNCIFEGDLTDYHIHFETDRIHAEITLHGNTAAWRPKSGHILFGGKKFFAWLPAVPEGSVTATITTDGTTITQRGTGYHDHNWGNTGMFWLMHHWYWGRAKIGDYQIISSYITARKKYGYEHFPIFLLAKDGTLLGDNPDYLTFSQTDAETDPVTGKYFHKNLVYDYNDGVQHYRITYRMEDYIEQLTANNVSTAGAGNIGLPLKLALKLAGLDPTYTRVLGTVTLERFEDDEIVEQIQAPGLWEQMYFGTNQDV